MVTRPQMASLTASQLRVRRNLEIPILLLFVLVCFLTSQLFSGHISKRALTANQKVGSSKPLGRAIHVLHSHHCVNSVGFPMPCYFVIDNIKDGYNALVLFALRHYTTIAFLGGIL